MYYTCKCGTPLISLAEHFSGMCTECYMDLPPEERKRVLEGACRTS